MANNSFEREVYEAYVQAKRSQSLDKTYRSTLQRISELIGSGGLEPVRRGGGVR